MMVSYRNALADIIEFGIDISPELKELYQEKFGNNKRANALLIIR